MKPPVLVRTNFRDFLQNMRSQLMLGNTAGCAIMVAIDHLTCNLSTVVFVLPKDHIYRCFPTFFIPADMEFEWLSKASALLDGGGLMKFEFKANDLRKKDFPQWLLNFHGSDGYSNPKLYLGYCFSSIMIPYDQVVPAHTYLCRWFDQINEHMYIQCSGEDCWDYGRPSILYGTDYDLLRYPIAPEGIFGHWHGEDGVLPRLQRKVAEIEAGGSKSLEMPPRYLTHSASLSSGRDMFFSRHTKHWLDEFGLENGDPNRPMNLEVLDLIFCLQCRLVRLLEWPQNYWEAKKNLVKEQAFTATHPMTQGLPYDPYVELSEYLSLMRQRYPILEESPYTADAFSKPPVAR